MDPIKLTLLAEVGALRALFVNLYAQKFLDEPDPLRAARNVKDMLALCPTQPPVEGGNLDPATSDVLAAMTDESIEAIMAAVIKRLEGLMAVT